MKILLAACNAKYIHSNLAVYNLKSCSGEYSSRVVVKEYTINQIRDDILKDIYLEQPDVVCFSCYIWNISFVRELVPDLKKILPQVEFWAGGPEVSYDAVEFLKKNPAFFGVMVGEGEETFHELAGYYIERKPETLSEIRGVAFRDENKGRDIVHTGWRELMDLSKVPFAYSNLTEFKNRIIYYESSRGCPFSCSYCLSSIDKSVRFRSLSLVKKELDFFLERKVPQVKFVDRTFNCRREHTLGIWKHILDHDNGITNFHFEVSADLFDQEELEMIGRMRPGLIQLEIGVQSTNPDTIREIRRKMDLTKLEAAVDRVHGYRNTHQHLDLIAGLPWEGLDSFLQSFDDVYRMEPDQLQLGFLKVLKGSYMASQAGAYGLRYRMTPPYEVLSTRWLSYEDVIRLKAMEEMVEVYYNSGQFSNTLKLLEQEYPSPSELFLDLAAYYEDHGFAGLSHSRMARYEILYGFIKEREERKTGHGQTGEAASDTCLSAFRDRLMEDLYLRENAKSRPSFAMDQGPFKDRIREFFQTEEQERRWLPAYKDHDSRQMANMAHLEAMEDGSFLLFDYKERDPLWKNARTLRFTYEETCAGTERGEYERIKEGQSRTGGRHPGAAGRGVWHRVPLLSGS